MSMMFGGDEDEELYDADGSMFNPFTREAAERHLEREADLNFPAPRFDSKKPTYTVAEHTKKVEECNASNRTQKAD